MEELRKQAESLNPPKRTYELKWSHAVNTLEKLEAADSLSLIECDIVYNPSTSTAVMGHDSTPSTFATAPSFTQYLRQFLDNFETKQHFVLKLDIKDFRATNEVVNELNNHNERLEELKIIVLLNADTCDMHSKATVKAEDFIPHCVQQYPNGLLSLGWRPSLLEYLPLKKESFGYKEKYVNRMIEQIDRYNIRKCTFPVRAACVATTTSFVHLNRLLECSDDFSLTIWVGGSRGEFSDEIIRWIVRNFDINRLLIDIPTPLPPIENHCICGEVLSGEKERLIEFSSELSKEWLGINHNGDSLVEERNGSILLNRRGWIASRNSYPNGVTITGRIKFENINNNNNNNNNNNKKEKSNQPTRCAILIRCPLIDKLGTKNVHHGVNAWISSDGNMRLSAHQLPLDNYYEQNIPVSDNYYDFTLIDRGYFNDVIFEVRTEENCWRLEQKFCDTFDCSHWCNHVVINTYEKSNSVVSISNLSITGNKSLIGGNVCSK